MAMSTRGRHDPRTNHLLAALPAPVLDRLIPQLTPLRAEQGQVFLAAEEAVERVYFPTGGLFSLLVQNREGVAVEAAVVGREGILGTAVVLGAPMSTFEERCQVDGALLALSAAALRAEFTADAAVRDLFLRYVAALLYATARSLACNRLHVTEQRLARWLLQVRDRVESDTFFLTQEFLGQMLGVRRPTVTEAVAALERAALIGHQRGRIRLLDDAGLEGASCEDYERIRAVYATVDRANPAPSNGVAVGRAGLR
jgi:CRP-like cAMP-binding protein